MKKTRKSIVAGQCVLLALGTFFIWAFFEIERTMTWQYSGPPPGWLLILGTFCLIAVLLLFSVVRYEPREERVEALVCPECGQSVPIGSKFCNNCGYEMKEERSTVKIGPICSNCEHVNEEGAIFCSRCEHKIQ